MLLRLLSSPAIFCGIPISSNLAYLIVVVAKGNDAPGLACWPAADGTLCCAEIGAGHHPARRTDSKSKAKRVGPKGSMRECAAAP
jgi:hypothetical protein